MGKVQLDREREGGGIKQSGRAGEREKKKGQGRETGGRVEEKDREEGVEEGEREEREWRDMGVRVGGERRGKGRRRKRGGMGGWRNEEVKGCIVASD